MEQELLLQTLKEFEPETSFTVISKGCVSRIAFDDVCFVRKEGLAVTIYTLLGSYKTMYSLPDILRELPVNDFFRVSKSIVVSLRKVTAIEKNSIHVADRSLPFTNYYRREMARHLGLLLNGQYAGFSICPTP